MDTPPPPDSRPPEKVFLENLPVIQEIVAHSARRFSPQDGEDFSQTVMIRLIEEDYRILREFKGRSSLRTYLAIAIKRMLLDYQNHLWGSGMPRPWPSGWVRRRCGWSGCVTGTSSPSRRPAG
jgi:hypothetical protein